MPDNFATNSASGGETFASDLIATVQHPRVKVQHGADGSATDVSTASPMPVDVRSSTVDVMLGADFSSVLGSANVVATDGSSALSIGIHALGTDGTNAQVISTNTSGHVNVADGGNNISVDWSGASPPIGAGTESAALRVTLATDSTGVVSVDDGGANLSIDWGGTAPPIGAGTEAAALRVTLATDSTGVVSVDDGGGSFTVDTANGFPSAYAVNSSVPTDPDGMSLVMERDDALSSLSEVAGDWTNLRSNARGALWVELDLANDVAISDGGNLISVDDGGGNLSVDWGGTTPPIGAGTEAAALRVTVATDSTGLVSVDGPAASGASVAGNPLLSGGEVITALPAADADGDVTTIKTDDLGRLITAPHSPRDLLTHNTIELTDTTETTLIGAGGSSVLRDLVWLHIANDSDTLTRVDIRDATSGTVRFRAAVAASGGGATIPFPVPLTQGTANNNWTAQLETAASSVFLTAISIDQN